MIDDTDTPIPDGGEVAADTTTQVTQADEVAAFSKGVDSLNESPVAADPPKVEAGATGAEKPVDAPGATAAAPTPEEKKAADEKAAEDAEIVALHLRTEKAAARFRELNAEAKKVPELLKQVEEYKPLAEEAKLYQQIVADTKATAEQVGTLFRYLKAVNTGDHAAMREGLKTLRQEVEWLAKELGEEVPGVDPVTEHPDLNELIEAGGMTREKALEMARLRAQEKQTQSRNEATRAEQDRVTQYNKAVDTGVASLNDLGARLKTSDPQYAAKLAVMQEAGTLETIKTEVHPSRWAEAFQNAFARVTIKAAPPAPARAPVGNMPLRPTGSDPGAMARVPKTDLEAFEIGAASVR